MVIALRRRFELTTKPGDHFYRRRNRFGRADRRPRSHDDAVRRKRNERCRRVGAFADIRDHRLLRAEQRVTNRKCSLDEAAGTVHVEHDCASVLLIRLVNRTLDQMGHPIVHRSGNRYHDDGVAHLTARGKPAEAPDQQDIRDGRSQPKSSHMGCYLGLPQKVTSFDGGQDDRRSVTIWRTRLPSAMPLSCGITTFITAPVLRCSAGSSAKTLCTISRISSADRCAGR